MNPRSSSATRWAVLWTLLIGLVLLPFLLFENAFNALGTSLAEGRLSGWMLPASIVLLLALDVFLPVPSSLVSTAAGALIGFWQGMATVWLGMTAGAALGYALGSRAAGAARRLVGDAGLDRARRALDAHGAWALAVCRPVPVLAEASVVFSGIAGTPLARFATITTLSNLGIAVAYAAVGAYAMRLESFLLAFFGAIALPGAAMLVGRRWLGSAGWIGADRS